MYRGKLAGLTPQIKTKTGRHPATGVPLPAGRVTAPFSISGIAGCDRLLLWRIGDVPDVLFRLSEIQRDIADIRKAKSDDTNSSEPTAD